MDLIFGTSHSWAIAVVRITLGAIFFAHGAQKVLGWFGGPGFDGSVKMFGQLGVAEPLASARDPPFLGRARDHPA